LKLEAFRVVFEHLVVDFVECRCFKIDARLVFALFPKKCGETKPQQQSNDHFRSWRVHERFQAHVYVTYKLKNIKGPPLEWAAATR
jgi:hypothetical protein